MLSSNSTPAEFFLAVYTGIADDMKIDIPFPVTFDVLKDLDANPRTELGQVYKALGTVDEGPQFAVIVSTRLGHVVMYNTVNDDDSEVINAVCHNALIPFIRLDPNMTISDIALVARPGNSVNNNISNVLDELLLAYENSITRK